MSDTTFISLAPNATDEAGHSFIYQNCLRKAAEQLRLPFLALISASAQVHGIDNWIPFFHSQKLHRLLDFCKCFRLSKEKRIFFFESFNTTDLLLFVLSGLLFSKKSDLICLLYRYDPDQFRNRGKVFQWLNLRAKKQWKERLITLTDSEKIADSYRALFGWDLTILPIPHTDHLGTIHASPSNTLRFWWPGPPREAKGWQELRLLAALKESRQNPIELIAAKASKLPSTTLIDDVLTREDYLARLEQSDIILLPYDPLVYRSSTSGILVEAIIAGKMPLVKEGSWLAYELLKYDLQELIVSWSRPDFFEHAAQLQKNQKTQEKLKKMEQSYTAFHNMETFTTKLKKALPTPLLFP